MSFGHSFVLLTAFLLIANASPLQFRKTEGGEGGEDNNKPIGDALLERIRKIQESLDGNPEHGGKEYHKYWEELVANNPDLAKRFKDKRPEEIAEKLGNRVAHRNGDIRSQIEELQRRNAEEMKELHRQKLKHDQEQQEHGKDLRGHEKLSAPELEKRIREHYQIQNELNHARHDEFKNYEMRLEHRRREKMKQMDELHRLKEEQKHHKFLEKLKEHEPLRHPASKKQLEDVWTNEDGLKDESFNARTFFKMHDTNGDGVLDVYEIEALFIREIKKIYGKDFDSKRGHEEMSRMREHVMSEMDRDRDGLVSLTEFLRYSDSGVFNIDEEWKPLDERNDEHFTEDELKAFENLHKNENFEDYDDYDDDHNEQNERDPVADHHELPDQANDHHPTQGDNKQPQEVPVSHQEDKKPQEVPVSHQEVPVSHQEVPVSHQEVPVSHQEVPVSHQEVPVSHQEVPVSHQEVPVSHQEDKKPQDLPTDSPHGNVGVAQEKKINEQDGGQQDKPVQL